MLVAQSLSHVKYDVIFRYYHDEHDIDIEPSLAVTTNENDNENNNEVTEQPVANPDADTDAQTVEPSIEKPQEIVVADQIILNIDAAITREIENIENENVVTNSSTPSEGSTALSENEVEEKVRDASTPPSNPEEPVNANISVKSRKVDSRIMTAFKKCYNPRTTISQLAKAVDTGVDASTKTKKMALRTSAYLTPNISSTSTSASLSGRESGSEPSSRYSSSAYDTGRSDKKKELLSSRSNTGNTKNVKLNRKPSKIDGDSGRQSSRRPSVKRKPTQAQVQSNINISADFCKNAGQTDCQSNMFLYIDLHGHASKKGVFMYGNYLPNVEESVECMLLPRLMSMNSHHFHFDACVFSERNMYHK